MKISVEKFPNAVCLLSVSGRLEALTSLDLKRAAQELLDEGYARQVYDLSQVEFIDSSGLAALVSGLRLAREKKGSIKIAGLQNTPRRIFFLSKLDRVFEFYPSPEAAIQSYAPEQA